mmetsp:Transcript_13576/g.23105  ORF Transcript_13576/g.23105 Transcript_13576/m.23105 type:complete len:119 (+) Transcript_13576:16-372(+)
MADSRSKPKLIEKLDESIELLMFNFPKKSKQEKIPQGYIPVDRLNYVLEELGFSFLCTVEQQELHKSLIGREDRDLSMGENMLHKKDLVNFLAKYIIEYTDIEKIKEAVNFFDMDSDG